MSVRGVSRYPNRPRSVPSHSSVPISGTEEPEMRGIGAERRPGLDRLGAGVVVGDVAFDAGDPERRKLEIVAGLYADGDAVGAHTRGRAVEAERRRRGQGIPLRGPGRGEAAEIDAAVEIPSRWTQASAAAARQPDRPHARAAPRAQRQHAGSRDHDRRCRTNLPDPSDPLTNGYRFSDPLSKSCRCPGEARATACPSAPTRLH